MKNSLSRLLLVSILLPSLVFAVQMKPSASAPKAIELSWPRTLQGDKHQFTFYQPQIDSMKKNRLSFRMALSLTQDNQQTHYGILSGECRLDIDKARDLAMCNDVVLDSLDFPNVIADQLQWLSQLNKNVSHKSFALSLARISANLKIRELDKDRAPAKFSFSPPKIYIAHQPTALITIDGKPHLRRLQGSSLMRVINTSFVIVLDVKSGWYYLQAGHHWMQAKAIEGPWKLAQALPQSVKAIEKSKVNKASETLDTIKHIIVTSKPASLIQIDGDAQYSPIAGTTLLYVSNSSDDVFLKIKNQRYYALISGRWYESKSLDDSSDWQYVPPTKLPPTFGDIPKSADKASVLSSVSGSGPANEAVIKNHIPQTAQVKRNQAKLIVRYDGKPQFKLIPETTVVYYAINADKAVFRVAQTYFANYQGIWFTSMSAMGPWTVATEVPDAIYSIPANSPHYNVTYNHVYGYTPEVVYTGYTPGYTGSFVSQNTVIYGTGYAYPGWTGTVYYGYPVTYGFNFYYTPYAGWYPMAPYARPLWFGAGVATGIALANHWDHWNHGWFGPRRYYGYHHGNIVNVNIHNTNIYNHWSKSTVIRHNDIRRNAIFPRGGHRPSLRPIHTRPSEPHPHQPRTVKGAQIRHKAEHPAVKHRPHPAVRKHRNNVYAGRDGHVYRHHQNHWERATSQGWKRHSDHRQIQRLEAQRAQRARANRHYQRRRSYQASFRERPREQFRPRGGFHGGRRF